MADKKAQIIIIKKKKGGGHGGHHGGAWKVAYADFVTAMMAFFLVMWLMGSDEEIKATVEEFFMNPNSEFKVDSSRPPDKNIGGNSGDGSSIMKGMNGGLPDSVVKMPNIPFSKEDKPVPDYLQSLEDLKTAMSAMQNLRLEQLKVSVPEKLLFLPGSSDFTQQAQDYLTKFGKFVASFGGTLKVEGFLLPIPEGANGLPNPSVDSYEFSMTRTVSVMAFLVHNRVIDEDRVQPRVLSGSPPLEGRTPASQGADRLIRFTLSHGNP